MAFYEFPCGCRCEILKDLGPEKIPLLDFYVEDPREPCQAIWDLLASARLKGIFQLETSGKRWAREMKPECIEQVMALVAILRPGAVHAYLDDGLSMSAHYCLRKNRQEEIKPYHPIVDRILKDEYGLLLYQETLTALARAVAGLTEDEAEKLRKAVGKKLMEEIYKVRDIFLEKGSPFGVLTEKQLKEVWGWIQASGRYNFNRSHAAGYAATSIDTLWIKAHVPHAFFVGWLDQAKNDADPRQELKELVEDARTFGFTVLPSDLRKCKTTFSTDQKNIWFGLNSIRGMGEANTRKVLGALQTIQDWSWPTLLKGPLSEIGESLGTILIRAGSLSWLGTRTRLESELKDWFSLTDKEREWLRGQNWTDLPTALDLLAPTKKEGGGTSNKRRSQIVRSMAQMYRQPTSTFQDLPQWVYLQESHLFGIPLTVSKLDGRDLSLVNSTCREVLEGRSGRIAVGVEVKKVREHVDKNGNVMAFVTAGDLTSTLDNILIFHEQWALLKENFTEGALLILEGTKSPKGGFVVERAHDLCSTDI